MVLSEGLAMSNYSADDFCSQDDGLDYIFAIMGAIYGATLSRHFDGVEPNLVRQVWKNQIGDFLTYKPSLDYALKHLHADFVPSAIKFRDFCNGGPEIPKKPMVLIEKTYTIHEQIENDRIKAEGLAKLKELKNKFKKSNEPN